MNARLRGIYAIINEGPRDPVAFAQAVLNGGIRIIQYRAKPNIVEEHARQLRSITRDAGAVFLLNDRWDRVGELDADGAHVGPDDVAFPELQRVREALAGRLLGVSCGTIEEAKLAQEAQADYIGAGSVYATSSKTDAGFPIGTQGLREIVQSVRLPVAAIGGIDIDRIPEVRESGAAMAAVLSVLSGAVDPQQTARALVEAWKRP